MAHLAAYLINLEGSDGRLAQATAQLTAAGLPFTRVAAFDGRGLAREEFPDYDHARALAHMGRPLRGGEVGCYLSHLEAARQFLASGAAYGLVLEDDLQLMPDFAAGLAAVLTLVDERAADWDLVHLAAGRHKIFTRIAGFEVAGQRHVLTRAHYFPMVTTALLWSRAGAAAFVAAHRQIWAPVDNYLRHWQLSRDRGLAVWPPLVKTSGVASEIAGEGGARRSVAGRTPGYGWIRRRRLLMDKLGALRNKWRARRHLG